MRAYLNGRMADTHKVLIVDDEDIIRVLLNRVLERVGVPNLMVLMAEDGAEALNVAEQERPDLILLDLLLPKMNGYDVCRALRQIPDYHPYIIILTARGQSDDREQAEAIGADNFMTKPFNPSHLLAEVSSLWLNADVNEE